jgi:hypothetical protein
MGANKIKKRIVMRIRKDSPFYGITAEEMEDMFQEAENGRTHDQLAEFWEQEKGVGTDTEQVTRFLARVRHERSLRMSYDSVDAVAEFAEEAASGKARDGLIEAARQRLFEEALANGDKDLLLELYRAANEERARERELAVSQRKAAVAEARLQLQERMAQHLLNGNGQPKMLVKGVVVSAAEGAPAVEGAKLLRAAGEEH